jgi:hypothetical protein
VEFVETIVTQPQKVVNQWFGSDLTAFYSYDKLAPTIFNNFHQNSTAN